MKKVITVALCVSVVSFAAPPREPIDEAVVAKLVKGAMSESEVRASYDACDSGGSISMKVCFRYRLERETMKLTKIYDELRHSLLKHSEADAKALVQAQDAWTAYQRLHCSFEGDIGTFDYGTEMLACQWELTKLRTGGLAEILERWKSVDRQ
jgi:uncharacterized protein YecT (DUF1311 family)